MIPKGIIARSIIHDSRGNQIHLEQLTLSEAKKRDLEPAAQPTLIERPGDYRLKDVFTIQDSDLTTNDPERKLNLVPDGVVAYVVGIDNRYIREHRGDHKNPPYSYIPVQFYKPCKRK